MNNPQSLVGQVITRSNISFPIEETTISRGSLKGTPRMVVSTSGATLENLVAFLGEEVAKDSLEASIRRASLDAHIACDVTTKDKNGVETTTFEEENYEAHFNAALEGGAAEGEKALREQRDALNAKYRAVTDELLKATKEAAATGNLPDVASFYARLEPLAERIQTIDAQIASKIAAREAKKNK